MAFSPLVSQLIHALQILPGVGPKSAQRMAFYLLEQGKDGGVRLAQTLTSAINKVGHCQKCRVFCETALCTICSSKSRDDAVLCIVESPANVAAIEQTGSYAGLYFVLSGRLSPIDGIGPEDIGIDELCNRLEHEAIKEVVLATSPTVEGEATAYYIADLVKAKGMQVSQIAQGVPLGGDLEYVDGGTLAKALADRAAL